MKKCLVMMLLVLVLPCMVAGCVSLEPQVVVSSMPERLILDAGDWPQNRYTAGVPQPESGVVENAWMENGYCTIELSGIKIADLEKYLKQLENAGFVKVAGSEEQVQGKPSIGLLFSKGGTSLSIAFYNERCTFAVTVENTR